MVGILHHIAVEVFIFCGRLHPLQALGIAVPAFDQEGGAFDIVQPVERGAHDMLLLVFRVEGELGIVVVLDLVHRPETEDRPELVRVFGCQQGSGAPCAVAA